LQTKTSHSFINNKQGNLTDEIYSRNHQRMRILRKSLHLQKEGPTSSDNDGEPETSDVVSDGKNILAMKSQKAFQ
jgi:hypothetical protein